MALIDYMKYGGDEPEPKSKSLSDGIANVMSTPRNDLIAQGDEGRRKMTHSDSLAAYNDNNNRINQAIRKGFREVRRDETIKYPQLSNNPIQPLYVKVLMDEDGNTMRVPVYPKPSEPKPVEIMERVGTTSQGYNSVKIGDDYGIEVPQEPKVEKPKVSQPAIKKNLTVTKTNVKTPAKQEVVNPDTSKEQNVLPDSNINTKEFESKDVSSPTPKNKKELRITNDRTGKAYYWEGDTPITDSEYKRLKNKELVK